MAWSMRASPLAMGRQAGQQQRRGTRGGDHLVGLGIAAQRVAEESGHGTPWRLGQWRDVVDEAFTQPPPLDGLGLDEQLGHRRPFDLELMRPVRCTMAPWNSAQVPSAWLRNMQVPSSATAICSAW